MGAVSWLATNVDWVVLGIGGVATAFCTWRSMGHMSAVMAQVSEDWEGDLPTDRVRRKQLRRGMQWGGGALLCLGLMMLGTMPTWNALPVVMMGFAMAKFPGLTCAPVSEILASHTDHEEPIGPAPKPPRHHYDRQQGPMTLAQWLDDEDWWED